MPKTPIKELACVVDDQEEIAFYCDEIEYGPDGSWLRAYGSENYWAYGEDFQEKFTSESKIQTFKLRADLADAILAWSLGEIPKDDNVTRLMPSDNYTAYDALTDSARWRQQRAPDTLNEKQKKKLKM